MSDVIDRATDEADTLLTFALTHRKSELQSTGKCHNCDEPVEKGLFCDTDCRDDHVKRLRMR